MSMWLIGHFKRPLITRDGRVHLPPHCMTIRGATSGSQVIILAQTWHLTALQTPEQVTGSYLAPQTFELTTSTCMHPTTVGFLFETRSLQVHLRPTAKLEVPPAASGSTGLTRWRQGHRTTQGPVGPETPAPGLRQIRHHYGNAIAVLRPRWAVWWFIKFH